MDFMERLRQYRRSQGFGLTHFARETGISVSTARRLDSGGRLSNRTVVRMCARLILSAPVSVQMNIIEGWAAKNTEKGLPSSPYLYKLKELLLEEQARELAGLKLAA